MNNATMPEQNEIPENVSEFGFIQQDRPALGAVIRGGEKYPGLSGKVFAYAVPNGVYLQADFCSLPEMSDFAFHIHEGAVCGNAGEIFIPLPDFSSDKDGKASVQVYLGQTAVTSIAGRAVMIHLKQNGEEIEIGCGVLGRIL